MTVPPKPLSAEYFDGWYANKADTPTVAEVMNRHLGFPPDLQAGIVPAEAVAEIAAGLRLERGDTLVDLACGRGAYGLLVTKAAGARLVGVDFSAIAVGQAADQAARLGVSEARFQVGELTASGLPDESADAVLCTDSIQFPDEPAAAYKEIRRILKPAGRVALTCWEPADRNDERLSERMRRVDLSTGLANAGFTDIEVTERPQWYERERAIWEEAVSLDPGDDPALQSFRDEGTRSLGRWDALQRVFAVATRP